MCLSAYAFQSEMKRKLPLFARIFCLLKMFDPNAMHTPFDISLIPMFHSPNRSLHGEVVLDRMRSRTRSIAATAVAFRNDISIFSMK